MAWAGTAADANDEWIELYNAGDTDVDLTGWALYEGDTRIIGLGAVQLAGVIAISLASTLVAGSVTALNPLRGSRSHRYGAVPPRTLAEIFLRDPRQSEKSGSALTRSIHPIGIRFAGRAT